MTFHAFGLNHETAPVTVREAFALDEKGRRTLYSLFSLSPEAEVVLLSTCNRTEVYLFGNDADVVAIQAALSGFAGSAWPADHAFALDDEAAVSHVLHVVSGLGSLVLGDAQILAQMKDAYRIAVEENRVGTVLHRLMHTAFRTAKRVRTETAISEGASSISSLAVRAARRYFEARDGQGIASRRVLLLGTGEMGMVALKALKREGADLTIANRSRARADAAARLVGGTVIDWSERHTAAAASDLVLVASGAPDPILWADHLPQRTGKTECLVVDVALPRNADPAVADVAGYTLLDLDQLSQWRDETVASRRSALPRAQAICAEGLTEYVAWVFNHEALQPAVQALRETFESIRQQEIDRHAHRFQSVDHNELDRLTRSIMQKLLAVPVVRLKNTDSESLDFARGVQFLSHVFARPGCAEETAEERAAQSRLAQARAAQKSSEAGCPFGYDAPASDAQEPASDAQEEEVHEARDARE